MAVKSNQEMALDAIKRGDYRAASVAFLALLKLDPKNIEFCLMTAEMAEKAGEQDLATKCYAYAARFYVNQNNIGQAVVMMKHYKKINPYEKNLYHQLFRACKNHNNHDELCLPLLSGSDKTRISLHHHHLFISISDYAFDNLLPHIQIKHFDDGDMIAHDGEKAECLYLIAKGGLLPRMLEAESYCDLAIIPAGGVCGEVPFMTGGKNRTADLTAVGETTLALIPYPRIRTLINTYPNIEDSLDDFYQKHLLERQLASTEFFDCLQKKDRKDVSAKLRTIHLKAGEVLFFEDATAPLDVFIVRAGWLSVNVAIDGKETLIYTAKSSHVLGDIGLLTKKRYFTVRAIFDAVVMHWLESDYQRCYDQHEKLRERVAKRTIAYQEAIDELRLGHDSTFVEPTMPKNFFIS